MNAISFIIRQHNKIRNTFKKISGGMKRHDAKKKLFDSLCHDLLIHETMEHKEWYPNFKNKKEVKLLVRHLVSEEKSAAKSIKQFKKIKSEEEWEEKFNELREDIEHHAYQEETELFPTLEEILDESTLKELGKNLKEFKDNNEFLVL